MLRPTLYLYVNYKTIFYKTAQQKHYNIDNGSSAFLGRNIFGATVTMFVTNSNFH